jgi:hypothetical protein
MELSLSLENRSLPCPLIATILIPVVIEFRSVQLEIILPDKGIIQSNQDTVVSIEGVLFNNHESIISTGVKERLEVLAMTNSSTPRTNITFSEAPEELNSPFRSTKIYRLDISTTFGKVLLTRPSDRISYDEGDNDTFHARIIFTGT